jgi:hypothetical protein
MHEDSEQSGAAAPPPDEFYRAYDGAIHRKPLMLYWRLTALRKKTTGAITTVTVIVSCIGSVFAQIGALWVYLGVLFGGIPGLTRRYAGNPAMAQAVELLIIAVALIIITGLMALLAYWAYRGAKGAFMRSYTRALTLIRDTPLAIVVADDQYWLDIFEMQRENPWLKWGVITPPKSIEQHLEFAAAYHSALHQIGKRFGKLEPKLITRGNCLWHAGTPACYGCPVGAWVLSLFPCVLFSWIAQLIYIWYTASALLAKNGILAAFCDFFLDQADFSVCPELLPDDGPVGI